MIFSRNSPGIHRELKSFRCLAGSLKTLLRQRSQDSKRMQEPCCRTKRLNVRTILSFEIFWIFQTACEWTSRLRILTADHGLFCFSLSLSVFLFFVCALYHLLMHLRSFELVSSPNFEVSRFSNANARKQPLFATVNTFEFGRFFSHSEKSII